MNRQLRWIDARDPLPPTDQALTIEDGANGLLAAGADLSAERLVEAYGRGIFPWFSRGEPVLWWTPSPRMVLMVDEFKISKSFRKSIARAIADPSITIRCNADFVGVMQACAAPRQSQSGTWISPPMIAAYGQLHATGNAHSIEVYRDHDRIGGLYCVALGKMVYGESMFSHEPGASKLALATLVAWLRQQQAVVIDCQQRTGHLASLGGREIDRPEFEAYIHRLAPLTELPWRANPPCKDYLKAL
jgi:leucyl/phenylalanyl-tRNA---protein transferase